MRSQHLQEVIANETEVHRPDMDLEWSVPNCVNLASRMAASEMIPFAT